VIRPGALFLVGGPKQAIYRFRDADVAAYIAACQAFEALGAEGVIPISTNFRSCSRILGYVNDRFEAVLSAPGQPGFTHGALRCRAGMDREPALLRGPLVGLTDEQLLDVVWGLPKSSDAPNKMGALNVFMPLDAMSDGYVRDVVEKLQALRRGANSTAPHDLLSQAVDLLRVRPVLVRRHRGQAERALSNVDLYLSLARDYSVRGLRAFAEAMTAAWSDESKEVEGRPDAQEEAVASFRFTRRRDWNGLSWCS
jgi:hypothetical protein